MGAKHSSPIIVEIDAITQAFIACKDRGWTLDRVCCDCLVIAQLISNRHPCIAWCSCSITSSLKKLIQVFPNILNTMISRDENNLADELVVRGRLNLQPSLFACVWNRPTFLVR